MLLVRRVVLTLIAPIIGDGLREGTGQHYARLTKAHAKVTNAGIGVDLASDLKKIASME